jgi:ParB family transcriptional regulator, chromosome partitioning protein
MTALNKQALRSKSRSASAGEWIKESGDGWEAICSAEDQANGNFIIAHFEGPDARANREFSQAAVIQELHNAFNQTTSEIAKLVNKSVATVEKLLTLSTANYDVQQEVKSGAVSVDVAVDRVREFGEQAGEVLQHDKAVAAAQGKTKVTRSSIAPELNIKSARRFVELMAMATISDEGVFTLQGTALAEALEIIDEHKAISEARETYRLSQPIPTTEVRGRTLYVMLDGKEIGSAIIYRGKNVTLDLGDKKIIASQSKAVAHFVKQHKLQQVDTNANDQ